ncbi:MAG: YebC/PmpR family DNA-binding transcriptional regulator [Pseudomonadota bacterium]
MAGHSQFKNIMHRKGAQDKKRAKVFTKIIRELTVAARSGPDPDSNPRLRSAIHLARSSNMPKDTMERAISRGSGEDGAADYEEMRYEGYGPGGVALIVDVLTDNRNRSASEVRSAFTKFGGNLGETNSVAFMFDRIGLIEYPADTISEEKIFEGALEAGATNVESGSELHEVQCNPDDLHAVREAMAETFGDPERACLSWIPKNTTAVDLDHAQSLFKLLEVLEDNDDVQSISANYEVSDEVLEQLKS